MTADDFVSCLRASAPYVHAHNGCVFVVAFGGEMADAANFDAFVYDLALLHSLGVRLVLVHGARPQIEREIARRGLPDNRVGEFRVTDLASLEAVKSAVGSLRLEIEARLSTSLASTSMGGARIRCAGGNWVTARPVGIRDGVDFQHTGEVRRIDFESIDKVLDEGRVALVSPVGFSPTGEIFNLRAADVASQLAQSLKADKLIYVTQSDPLAWSLASRSGDSGQISLAEAELAVAGTGEVERSDKAILQSALDAGRGGVGRVHIVGGQIDGVLLRELYSRDGGGLMIYSDQNYESVRAASIEDVGGILALIKPQEEAGKLVQRSREQLELEIGRYDVMVRDGLVVACCALFPFEQQSMAEISSIVVHPDYRKSGRAAALLARAERSARDHGIRTLFTLTTQTPHWFIERGFKAAKLDELPMERQALYNYQRNSAVLVKAL